MLQFKMKFQNKSLPYSIQSYSRHLSNHGFNRICSVPLTLGRSSDLLFHQFNIFDQSEALRHFNSHHSYTNQNQIGHGYKTHCNPILLLSTAHFSTQIDDNLSQLSSTSDTNDNYTDVETDVAKTLKVADFYTSTDNQHHHNYKSITLHNTSELIEYLSFCINEDEIEYILKLLKSAGKKIKSIPKTKYIRTTSTTDDYVTETAASTVNISSSLLSDRNKIKQSLYWVQTWIDQVFVSKTMQVFPIVVPDYSYDTSLSSTANNGMRNINYNDNNNNNNTTTTTTTNNNNNNNMHVSNLDNLKRKLANMSSNNNSVCNGQHNIDSSSLSTISLSSQNSLNTTPIANNHLLKKQLIEVIQLYNEYNEIYSFIPRFDDSIKNIDHVINIKNIKTDPSILPHEPQPQDLALYNTITPTADDNNTTGDGSIKNTIANTSNNSTMTNNNANNTKQMLETALTSFNSLSLEQSVTLLCLLYPTFILQNIYHEIIRYISTENSAIKQLNLNLRTFVGGDVDPEALYVLLNILSSCPHNYTLHIVNKKKDTKKGLVFSLEDEITINLLNLQQYNLDSKNMNKQRPQQQQKQLSGSSGRKVKTAPIEKIDNKVAKKAKIKIRKLKMDINNISNSNDDETGLNVTTQVNDGDNDESVISSSVTNKNIKPTKSSAKSVTIEDNNSPSDLSSSSSSSSSVKSDVKDNNKKEKQQSLLKGKKSKKQSTKASDHPDSADTSNTTTNSSNNNSNTNNKKKGKNSKNKKSSSSSQQKSSQPPKEVLEANLFEELDRMAKNVIHRFTTKSRLNISILCTYNEYQAERECHHVSSLNDVESGMDKYFDKTVSDSVYFNDTNSSSSGGDVIVARTIEDSDISPSPSDSDTSSIVTANSSLQKEPINFSQFVERTDDYYGRLVHRMHRNIYRQNYTGTENTTNNSNKPRHLLNEAANFNIFTDELGVYHNSNDIEDEHLHITSNHNNSSNNVKEGEEEEEEEDKSMYKVFVSEIPSGVSRENIINVFCKVGNVVDVVYVPNTELNREEFADYLITMEEEATAAAAAVDDNMDSTELNISNNNALENINNNNNEDDSVLNSVSKIISKRKNATNDPVIIQQSNQRINKLRNLINPSTSKQIPKKVIRHYRPDGHAFVFFDNKESYELAIGDDFRILGINLMGTNCYVHSAHLSTTLYIEFLQTINTANIINIFKLIFGEQWEYTVNLSNYEDLNPVFVHLKFRTHEEAWESYKILDAEPGIYDILHITWCKSTWYRAVAKKEKEFSYERQENKARFDVSTIQIMTESSSFFFKKDSAAATNPKEENTVDNNRTVVATSTNQQSNKHALNAKISEDSITPAQQLAQSF